MLETTVSQEHYEGVHVLLHIHTILLQHLFTRVLQVNKTKQMNYIEI